MSATWNQRTLVIMLAGGQGERLYPLTRDRAKPAVPFGGTYRIVDFSLSNCLNSAIRRIHVLTQYRSLSLQRHLSQGWSFLHYELGEFIDVIPPQQRTSSSWYAGTADAVYQNIYTLEQHRPEFVLILSGDHIYRMDYQPMLADHEAHGAELTVACLEVPRAEASRFGVAQIDDDQRIVQFWEKPDDPAPIPGRPDHCLVSMGVYVFSTERLVREVIADAKRDSAHDFGQDIIPGMVPTGSVYAHRFQDPTGGPPYWRDIGTLDAYWESNLDLVRPESPLDLYGDAWPVHTYPERRAPAKIVHAQEAGQRYEADVSGALIAPGCFVRGARIRESVLSPNVRIEPGAQVEESVLLEGVQVGRGAQIRQAIIDKRVRIPAGMVIAPDADLQALGLTVSSGGVVVIPREMPFE